MQGGGADLHHQQLTAEKAERFVQNPVLLDLKLGYSRHPEGVVTVDSAHVPHHYPLIIGAGCDSEPSCDTKQKWDWADWDKPGADVTY